MLLKYAGDTKHRNITPTPYILGTAIPFRFTKRSTPHLSFRPLLPLMQPTPCGNCVMLQLTVLGGALHPLSSDTRFVAVIPCSI
jgi:hypothetical protein